MNNKEYECKNINDFLKNIDADSLLNNFETCDEGKEKKYYTCKGIYALYLKDPENFDKLFGTYKKDEQKAKEQETKENIKNKKNEQKSKENIKSKIENEIQKIKRKLEEQQKHFNDDKRKNLFYIGKTCNSFQARLFGSNGHKKGGKTSFSNKIYSYLYTDERKNYTAKDKDGEKKAVANWFKDNISVELYDVEDIGKYQDIIISIIEERLIKEFNPPLNSIGCNKGKCNNL